MRDPEPVCEALPEVLHVGERLAVREKEGVLLEEGVARHEAVLDTEGVEVGLADCVRLNDALQLADWELVGDSLRL